MHCLSAEAAALASAIAAHTAPENTEILLCPPFTALNTAADALTNSTVQLGGQDCHTQSHGAFTGNISTEMLKDTGCAYVLVGHSERRALHAESSALVREKALAAQNAGLTPIICIGETLEEKEAGKTNTVVEEQLKASLPENSNAENCVIAYEPVWAIGTGKTATADDIANTHAHIAHLLEALTPSAPRILYGGSVKPDNAAEILSTPHVGGVLVGGASLDAASFTAIIDAGAGAHD